MDSHIWSHSSQQEHPLQKPDRPKKKYCLEDRELGFRFEYKGLTYIYIHTIEGRESIIGGEN